MRLATITPLLLCAALLAPAALARTVTVPISLNYQLIEAVARSQLFVGPENSADLYADPTRCNALTLTDPTITGTADGQLVLEAGITANGGSPLGGNCLPLFAWSGTIRTQQKPYIKDDGAGLGFHVTDIHMEPADLSQPQMPPMLQGWVTAFINPALESLSFDLKSVLGATKGLLYEAIPGGQQDIDTIANSVAFADISGNAQSLVVSLQLDLPETLDLAAVPTDTLSQQELASWDAAWQSWDAFATWLIKNLASQTGVDNPALTAALADSLMEARYDLRQALVDNNQTEDPVRQLFLKTWERLTPVLQAELSQSGELQGLQYLGFISAVDALMAIDQVAESFSVQFDSATLRALARLINPSVTESELNYSLEEDPELRTLLGLEPTFDGTSTHDDQWSAPLAFLIAPAEAAQLDPTLVKKLNRWVPNSGEVDTYLTSMQQVLDAVAAKELEKGKIPQRFFAVYENLLLATAWQESCWRQFVASKGQITPLKSSAGSVGLMQVNQHVWRGVYNTNSLVNDLVYNAKAGNEILVHYLVDYAIKKKEHELGGGADALARSTYAMYNGGPGHISRYRKDTTGKYLKQIDAAFLKKYRDIQSKGTGAVKSCYGQ